MGNMLSTKWSYFLDGTYVGMVCKAHLHINASNKDKLYDFVIQLPNSSLSLPHKLLSANNDDGWW